MVDRVTFSAQNVDIRQFAYHYRDFVDSVNSYFARAGLPGFARFAGYTRAEVDGELTERLVELEKTSSLTVLSAIEAAFRIDFLQRCYLKKKDPVSRAFRSIHGTKGRRVAIDDDIFAIWREHTTGASVLIGQLRGVFRYRHWLAHGRYWEPRLGHKYDYLSVYALAESALQSFPLLGL